MKTLEIVFGNSCYYTMNNSKINDNILMFNVLFNAADLSNIAKYKIDIPKELVYEKSNTDFKIEHDKIIENIKKGNKIRIWCGRRDIYSYLVMLYLCSIINKYDYDLYVVYSDDYNKEYPSPRVMNENELIESLMCEKHLSKEELINNANIWEDLVQVNSKLRVIENGVVKSVSYDYYNEFILDTLNTMGRVKMSQLVGRLMSNVCLFDIFFVYLINILIKNKKIRIFLNENERYFDSLVEVIK